jgi:hypothetical protein
VSAAALLALHGNDRAQHSRGLLGWWRQGSNKHGCLSGVCLCHGMPPSSGCCCACRREKERLVTLSKCFKHLNAVVSPLYWAIATCSLG